MEAQQCVELTDTNRSRAYPKGKRFGRNGSSVCGFEGMYLDDEVDRSEVEAQQCVELTDTNRSRAYPKGKRFGRNGSSVCGFEGMYLIKQIK